MWVRRPPEEFLSEAWNTLSTRHDVKLFPWLCYAFPVEIQSLRRASRYGRACYENANTKRPSKFSRKHSTLINANTAKCCGIHLVSQRLRRLRQEEHWHHLRWHKVILCWKKNKDFIEFHTSRFKEQAVDTQWYCPFLPQTFYWQVHGGSYLVCVMAPSFVNRNITALCILKAAMRHFINNSYIGWQSCSSLEISEMIWSGFKIQFSTSACFFHLVPSLLHTKESSKGDEGGKRHTLLRLCRPQHMPEYQTGKAKN